MSLKNIIQYANRNKIIINRNCFKKKIQFYINLLNIKLLIPDGKRIR